VKSVTKCKIAVFYFSVDTWRVPLEKYEKRGHFKKGIISLKHPPNRGGRLCAGNRPSTYTKKMWTRSLSMEEGSENGGFRILDPGLSPVG
jgi:hypothetical protein